MRAVWAALYHSRCFPSPPPQARPLRPGTRTAVDLLNGDELFPLNNGKLRVTLPPHWARIMALR